MVVRIIRCQALGLNYKLKVVIKAAINSNLGSAINLTGATLNVDMTDSNVSD